MSRTKKKFLELKLSSLAGEGEAFLARPCMRRRSSRAWTEMLPPSAAGRPWSFRAYQEGGRAKIYPTEGRKEEEAIGDGEIPVIGCSSKSQGMEEVHHYLPQQ